MPVPKGVRIGGYREVQQMVDTAQAVESKKPKRGRKPADESRARILRSRLVVWKQTPESQRVSLRTLAAELGTSHQLLAFYLRGLDEWQRKDYERRAEDIRDRANAENRSITSWEESQVKALERAAATPNNYFFSEPFSHTSRVVKLQDLHLNSVAAPELGGA